MAKFSCFSWTPKENKTPVARCEFQLLVVIHHLRWGQSSPIHLAAVCISMVGLQFLKKKHMFFSWRQQKSTREGGVVISDGHIHLSYDFCIPHKNPEVQVSVGNVNIYIYIYMQIQCKFVL